MNLQATPMAMTVTESEMPTNLAMPQAVHAATDSQLQMM